jgi:hypothetical protein
MRLAHIVGVTVILAGMSAPAASECVAIKYRDTPVCLDTFKCVETPQSSFVRKVCFDAAQSYLVIKLNDVWYHYCAVDRVSFENLTTASSIGSYYNQNFRSHGTIHGPFDCRDHRGAGIAVSAGNRSPSVIQLHGRSSVSPLSSGVKVAFGGKPDIIKQTKIGWIDRE